MNIVTSDVGSFLIGRRVPVDLVPTGAEISLEVVNGMLAYQDAPNLETKVKNLACVSMNGNSTYKVRGIQIWPSQWTIKNEHGQLVIKQKDDAGKTYLFTWYLAYRKRHGKKNEILIVDKDLKLNNPVLSELDFVCYIEKGIIRNMKVEQKQKFFNLPRPILMLRRK